MRITTGCVALEKILILNNSTLPARGGFRTLCDPDGPFRIVNINGCGR